MNRVREQNKGPRLCLSLPGNWATIQLMNESTWAAGVQYFGLFASRRF